MAPRKLTDDQLDEIRQMFETFTAGIQTAFQTSVENALTTVLQAQRERRNAPRDQHQHQARQHNAQLDASDEEDMVDNLFAAQVHDQRDRRDHNHADRRDDHREEQDQRPNLPNRWESSFRTNIPEFS
uniref:Uncharacterized protein n=1 Tax=Brassica oleracea var. oleracea TaxID=109376 RepID=A0A0D3BDP9_BRAOL